MDSETTNKLQQIVEQNLINIEEAKEQGQKVVGFYCLYSPMELILAAGAIPLPLCGTRNDPIEAAETVLPRNLCPLIKSSYGFAAPAPFLCRWSSGVECLRSSTSGKNDRQRGPGAGTTANGRRAGRRMDCIDG